jgi:hypothetical protein
MWTKDLRSLMRHFFDECNKGKVAAIAIMDEFYTPNFVFHIATGQNIRGIEDYKQYMSEFFTTFPGAHFTIDDIVVEGDKVAVRYTVTCTHKGEFVGIPLPIRS